MWKLEIKHLCTVSLASSFIMDNNARWYCSGIFLWTPNKNFRESTFALLNLLVYLLWITMQCGIFLESAHELKKKIMYSQQLWKLQIKHQCTVALASSFIRDITAMWYYSGIFPRTPKNNFSYLRLSLHLWKLEIKQLCTVALASYAK